MEPGNGGGRSGWATLGLLLAVGLVLGFLADRAVRTVLAGHRGATESVAEPAGSAALRTPATEDSLLALATPGLRDPFRAPPAPRSDRTVAAPSQAPSQLTGTPVVRALLYDNVNPTVQIGIGSVTSGWLHAGDLFQGWTVVEISSTSVRITRNGESVVLPSS